MLDSKAASYLLGYFYGDGSARAVRGRYRQYRFFCTEDDIERVDDAARSLGVQLKWTKGQKGVKVATWSLKHLDKLPLEGLEDFNSYTRRLVEPLWLDKPSFLEGIWDADGSVGRNAKGRLFIHLGLTNPGLIEDVKTLCEDLGMKPTVSGTRHVSLVVNKTDWKRFAEALKLQPKKDSYLQEIRG